MPSVIYAEKLTAGRRKSNPLVTIAVIKKPGISNVRSAEEDKQKKKEEDNKTNTTWGTTISVSKLWK